MLYLLASIPSDDEGDQDEIAYNSENEAIDDDDDLKNDTDYVLPEGTDDDDDDDEETFNKTTRHYK